MPTSTSSFASFIAFRTSAGVSGPSNGCPPVRPDRRTSGPGDKFMVPANSSFDIRVREAYHYICHFG